MTLFGIDHRLARQAIFRSTNIPAAIALIAIAICGFFADSQNRLVYRQALRAEVLSHVSVVRAKLEGNINGNLQLVRGLIATLMTEPEMDQVRFSQLSEMLFREQSQLRNIAAAPDLVVSMVYPLEGNEKAIGLDYRSNEKQREAVLRAKEQKRLVLAGPVELVQGGTGFIGRFPVFLDIDKDTERFWGVVSAVVDAQRLYADSGLLDGDEPVDFAISGQDSQGEAGAQFFGPAGILSNEPVSAEITLPSGTWTISAVPKGGWDVTPPNWWWLWLMVAIAGALVVIPMLLAGRLVDDRRKHFRELLRREQQLERLSHRLELALEASRIGVWEHDLETDALVWDERINEIYGRAADGMPRAYMDWAGAIHPDDVEQAKKDFENASEIGRRYASEYRIVLPDGALRYIRARGSVYAGADGRPKMIGAEWDVTADVLLNKDLERAKDLAETRNAELEAAKASIEFNSLHDSLTGLPNRRYLDDIMETYAEASARSGKKAALLHIDLDRFKQINDTLGHAAGDAMLIHASQVLKANVRDTDFVARIGGDEFVVMCTFEETTDSLAQLADRIIRQMREPVPYQGHECRFGVSVGIAIESGDAVDAKRLMVNADIALYRAKSRGRNRYEFFTEALQAEIIHTKRIADEILNGLERDEFVAYYQPQFDARTLEIVGVEALARWNHPTEGLLAPDAFLKTAEELNVVATIDRRILEQTLGHFRAWEAAGVGVPRVSVNVSARRLRDEELIASLRNLDIRPGTVSFELVESIFLDDEDEFTVWNVDQIKELGIDIEIDDFGTGYASIVSLLKLKPRRLKIDRQLVMPIVTSAKQRNLVESIIEIGRSLGIEVVAEGVETMEHARLLKELGCDALQGYAFGRPMSAQALAEFVRTRGWRAAS